MNAQARWIVSAAAALVVSGMAPSAGAQYQTSNSMGNALDANNRLGSGGVNDTRRLPDGVTSDDVVYGNVTGGRQFRGNVSSTDPRAFRGGISRPSDNLVRDAGASAYQQGPDRFTPQRYFGESRGVAAPAGYEQIQPGSPGRFAVDRPNYRIPGDVRMDATIPNPELGVTQPSVYILPGVTTESPMAGDMTRSLSGFDRMPDLIRPTDAREQVLTNEFLRRINLSPEQLREMREEYLRGGEEDERAPRDPNDLTVAPETPINETLGTRLRSGVAQQSISGDLQTQQSLQQRLLTQRPMNMRQDAQYATLQDRFARLQSRREMTDEEANRQFMQEWTEAQKQRQAELTGQDTGTGEVTLPGPIMPQRRTDITDEEPLVAGPDRRRLAMRQELIDQQQAQRPDGILPPQPELPVKIASFADGVHATGLKKLLAEAEESMRGGRFTDALDHYDAAAAVAPDNAMVLMGRALAELGAGYYARAQVRLEQILSADPALLMARYDLKAFYGEDRLAYLVSDLKALTQSETTQARPLFLLGFIAYSTENEENAANYLTLAEQRGGPTDFYRELREYWALDQKQEPEAPANAPQ